MLGISTDVLALIVPCGIVNISLNVLGAVKRHLNLERFDRAFDRGAYLGKQRLLGDSTTWLGFFLAFALGVCIQFFFPNILGIIAGIGTFFGHALGSFIKRRLGIGEGKYLPVVDHGDYIIFTGLIFIALDKISWPLYGLSVLIILAVHPLFCLLGFKIGIRTRKL